MLTSKFKKFVDFFVLIASALLADFIIFGLLGRVWWFFDLFSNFQAYYFIFALIALIYFLLRRKWKLVLIPLAVILVSGWMFFSVYIPRNSSSPVNDKDYESAQMRVLFYNIFAYNNDFDGVANYVNDVNPDLFIVAEMVENSFNEIAKRIPEYKYKQWEDGVSTGGDIAFFSKIEPTKINVIDFNESFNLPWFRFEFTIKNKPLVVYGIHPSPPMNSELYKSRSVQLEKLAEQIKKEDSQVVVIGDFNTTPYSPVFQKLLSQSGLNDSRRGFGVHASWPNWLPAPFRIPIDHSLISDNVVLKSREIGLTLNSEHIPFATGTGARNIESTKGSDHLPLVIDFQW